MKITITPEQFAARAKEVDNEIGETITGNSGQLAHNGVTIDWHYDGVSTLELTMVKKPFFVSAAMVENTLLNWFKS